MSWIPPPLATPRLSLVAPADSGQAVFSDDGRDAVAQSLPGLPANWRISRDGEFIGMIGFIRWEPASRLGEIGFFIAPACRGCGYMTEAGSAVVAFGFLGMGLSAIEAKTLPENSASVRVLEKIGMKKVARIRAPLSSKGAPVDLDLYAIQRPAVEPFHPVLHPTEVHPTVGADRRIGPDEMGIKTRLTSSGVMPHFSHSER